MDPEKKWRRNFFLLLSRGLLFPSRLHMITAWEEKAIDFREGLGLKMKKFGGNNTL